MKSLQLNPTETNLISTYKMDSIRRNEDIHSFVDTLYKIEGQMTICIDGKWGSGKTFFIKQTKMILDAMNDVCLTMSEETKNDIKNSFAQSQKKTGVRTYDKSIFSVYYDAWENDNDFDPLLSIIYGIVKAANCMKPVTDNVSFIDMATSIVSMVSGTDISKLFDQFKHNDITAGISQQKSVSEAIHEFLDTVIQERGDRLVVFIDELDRCKPSYAVSLLERVKHYFDNENVTFVLTVNSAELIKTIRKFYGDDFSAQRYLDRFFDFTFPLPEIDNDEYFFYIERPIYDSDSVIDKVVGFMIKRLSLSLREIAHYFNYLDNVGLREKLDNYMKSRSFGDSYTEARYLCLGFVSPIMIGLFLFDKERYKGFINGENSELLKDALDDLGSGENYYYNKMLEHNESYSDEPEKIKVTAEDKVASLCQMIFRESSSSKVFIRIGDLCFGESVKKYLLSITNLLKNSLS